MHCVSPIQASRPGAGQHYDLSADQAEETNLVESRFERVTKMKADMEQAIARGRTTPGPDQQNDTEIVLVK